MVFWEIEYMDGTTDRQYNGVDPNNPPKQAKFIRLIENDTVVLLEVEIPPNCLPVYAKERRLIGLGGNKINESFILLGYNNNGVRTMKQYSLQDSKIINTQDNLG